MLDEAQQDKMIKSKDKAVKRKDEGNLKSYSFPGYGITVKAGSLAEAEEKLAEIINKK